MSFLPYSSIGAGNWFAATTGSIVTHGLIVAVALSGVQQFLDLSRDEGLAQPEYVVTLERLDSDTIAGLLEQQGEAGSDGGEGVDSVLPEAEPEVEPERLAALTPDEVETPDPVTPDPVVETPDEVEANPAEGLEAVAPDALAPEAIQPITPQATAPVQENAGPLIAETVSAAPVLEALTPLISDTPTAQGIAPVPSAPNVLKPTSSSGTVIAAVTRPSAAAVQPARPPAAPPPVPTAQDLAIGDLLRRIQSAVHEPCLLALPRRDGDDGIGIALIGQSEAAMERFAAAVLTGEDAEIRQTRTLVDARQCAALGYIRDNQDYPATRLGVRLDAPEVATGGRMTGVLRGTAGRYVLLLLVDNNGVVQDLQRFMAFSGNFTRFDVPVTRAGSPRDTKQMLIAIATRQPLTVLRSRAGQLAQNVFADLEGEVATGAALAVTTFDVR